MKTLLFFFVSLTGVLAVTAAAVGAVDAAPQELQENNQMEENEPAVVAPEVEAFEAAPMELQENNQMAENELAVAAPEEEELEMISAGEMASSPKGRFFTCPPGWERYRNGCYLYVTTTRTWSSAAANCASLGASLASVQNLFDYTFLQDLTARRGGGSSVAWMGGFYFQTWRWVDQTPYSYSFWSTYNSVSRYQCMYLNTRAGWSNHLCTNAWPSICMRRTDTC